MTKKTNSANLLSQFYEIILHTNYNFIVVKSKVYKKIQKFNNNVIQLK